MFSSWISDPSVLLAGVVLATVQFVAALPWLWAIDPKGFKSAASSPASLGYVVLGLLVAGVGVAMFLGYKGDAANLTWYGRYIYGAVLHLQLIIACSSFCPRCVMLVWPKGGVVAFAAFRESCRQPMFWLIAGAATVLIWISVAIPYFTFGDDYKMMKQIGFDVVMLAATLFGVLAASMSISEEIEGRTAVTLMSKPVNRRQFLIGKFLGILMACLVMSMLLELDADRRAAGDARVRPDQQRGRPGRPARRADRQTRRPDDVPGAADRRPAVPEGGAERARQGRGPRRRAVVLRRGRPHPRHRPRVRAGDDPCSGRVGTRHPIDVRRQPRPVSTRLPSWVTSRRSWCR